MNLAAYIASAIARPQKRSFSSFIVRLCIFATALSLCVMILGSAVYEGFQQNIKTKFNNSWGHIHVMTSNPDPSSFISDDTLYEDASLKQKLKTVAGVSNVSSVGIQSALVKYKNEFEGIALKGFDSDYNTSKINIISGKAISFGSDIASKQIILSNAQAKVLKAKVNDSVIVYVVNSGSELPRARKLQVVGIYETGLYENDKMFAIVDLGLIRQFQLDTMGRIYSYEINVTNENNIAQMRDHIFQNYINPPLTCYTTEERFSKVFQWLGLVKQNLSTIYIILIIVALINVATCLLILVLERSKMIGMLKSFGASNWLIQRIFIWQNLAIVSLGILSGIIAALILGGLQQNFKFVKLDPEIYYIDHVQVVFNWQHIAQLCLITLALFTLILVLVSVVVRYVTPLKAIRFD